MRYKFAILDFDGTLADSLPWFLTVVDELAVTHNFQRPVLSELDLWRGCSAAKVLAHHRVALWKLPAIGRHLHAMAARDAGKIPLFPGVDELFSTLKQAGVNIAIVSSNGEANVRRILGPRNEACVSAFECGASVFGKRTKFKKVLRNAGVRAEEALCVGDEVRDVEAAKAEGIPFGAVAWGYTHMHTLQEYAPEETFLAVTDIAACFQGSRVEDV